MSARCSSLGERNCSVGRNCGYSGRVFAIVASFCVLGFGCIELIDSMSLGRNRRWPFENGD